MNERTERIEKAAKRLPPGTDREEFVRRVRSRCRTVPTSSAIRMIRKEMADEETAVKDLWPAPVQDALASAGLSRRSELGPDRIERAEELARGRVSFETEAGRRAFIMDGPKLQREEPAMAAGTATKKSTTKAAPREKSNRAKAQEAGIKALQKAEGQTLTRAELNKVRVKLETKATVADWINDMAREGTTLDGFGVKRGGERGTFILVDKPAE